MQNDILAVRATNARNFYRNNIISKKDLEDQVKPYLEKHNMTLSTFLSEDAIRRISSRKNKRRVEKARFIGAIIVLVLWLYIVGESDQEVRQAEILAYNY